MLTLSRPSRWPRGDAGITLTELLVTMVVMMVVGVVGATFFIGTVQANQTTQERGYNTSQARDVLDSWTALLRVADSATDTGSRTKRFLKVTPFEIQFYANVDNRQDSATQSPSAAPTAARSAPTLIDLQWVAGKLQERRTSASGTSTHILASFVAPPTSNNWLFTPFANSVQLPLTVSDCVSGTTRTTGYCGSDAADGTGTDDGRLDLLTVDRIDIAFTVSDPTSRAPVSFMSSVSIVGPA